MARAVDKDELTSAVPKAGDVPGRVDEVLRVEEDPVTATGKVLEKAAIADEEDGDGIREDA